MNKRELAIVERHMKMIFGDWHACALRKPERGMPAGTLCDDCNDSIKAHMKDIARACGNENLAKLEDEEATKWTRKSYRLNGSRA